MKVPREALLVLEARYAARQAYIDKIRAEIQKGIDTGPATEWSKDEFLKKAHARMDKSGYNI